MSLGGGYSKSNQQSDSQSGLQGTPGFGPVSNDVTSTSNSLGTQARNYSKTPFGFFQGHNVNQLVPTNSMGLPTELNSALTQLGNDMFSKASAGGALRGQVDQQNTPGIVGSSLQNIGQFLTPYILDFKKYMTSLPDTLMNSRLGFLQNTLGAQAPLLGSKSTYSGNSFGVNAQGSLPQGKA